MRLDNLVSGNSASCGCATRERAAERLSVKGPAGILRSGHIPDGRSLHPLYDTHKSMMRRCYDPSCRGYRDYGGRGIGICQDWHDFWVFASWVDNHLGERPARRSLDRVDNDGDYEPGNVKWSTSKEQVDNQRRSRHLTKRLRTLLLLAERPTGVRRLSYILGTDVTHTVYQLQRDRLVQGGGYGKGGPLHLTPAGFAVLRDLRQAYERRRKQDIDEAMR